MKGFIKTLVKNKNYGFIRAENNGEYFFHKEDFYGHWTDLIADFENEEFGKILVTFTIAISLKGPRASDVKRLDFPNEAV
jgi:cold shock CspA family protein